jgi:hypothetical protein
MKPFNLQAAINGEPIQTRDGWQLKFVAHVPEAYFKGNRVIVMNSVGNIFTYCDDGQFFEGECESVVDIVMATVIKTVYANVFKGKYFDVVFTSSETFNSVAEAVEDACVRNYTYIKTIEITIEE